jgi:nicotinate phosphoribosyltransferase
VILYEVPILSILSEAYFQFVDTKWDYVGQHRLAKQKGIELLHEGIAFSEFGTRRRRSYEAQKIVMQGLVDARNELTGDGTLRGKLTGTSNVHFAMEFGVNPVGTIAHEWIMGIAAMEGYEGSNALAMKMWESVYPDGSLRVALTDTFSTKRKSLDNASNIAELRVHSLLYGSQGQPGPGKTMEWPTPRLGRSTQIYRDRDQDV